MNAVDPQSSPEDRSPRSQPANTPPAEDKSAGNEQQDPGTPQRTAALGVVLVAIVVIMALGALVALIAALAGAR